MSLEKSELIEKLGVISARYNDVVDIKIKMDCFVPEDIYIRQIEVPEFPVVGGAEENAITLKESVDHTDETGKNFMSVYESLYPLPPKPEMPKKRTYAKPSRPNSIQSFFAFAILAFIASAIALFTNLYNSGTFAVIIYIVSAVIASAGVALLAISIVKLMRYKAEVRKSLVLFYKYEKNAEDRYNNQLIQHQYDIDAYKEKEQAYIDVYWAWRAIYLEHLDEEERVKAQLEIDRQEAVKQIEENELVPAKARLNEANDLLSEKYLPAIDKIIDLIKDGRADDLKEAINLYEEILYKERQQLEREMGELIRREEERRREEEERQLKEEAINRQCNSCANFNSCGVRYARPNCASYLPKPAVKI